MVARRDGDAYERWRDHLGCCALTVNCYGPTWIERCLQQHDGRSIGKHRRTRDTVHEVIAHAENCAG